MIGLAHLGGPIACFALALLLVAKNRRERLAALGFAAFGTCVLLASVSPQSHVLELVGGFLGVLAAGLFAIQLQHPYMPHVDMADAHVASLSDVL